MAKKKKVAKKAAKKTSKALTKGNTSMAPSYIDEGHAGKENFRAEDQMRPFLRMCQSNSPQVVEKKAQVGDFVNTVTGKIYGPSVRISVLAYQFSRMHFEGYDEGGGILCQSNDGLTANAGGDGKTEKGKATADCAECTLSQWTENKKGDNKPPECTEMANYLVVVEGDDQPSQLVIANTSWKAHKKLASMIQQSKYAIYSGVYVLSSFEEVKKSGAKTMAFQVMTVEAAGFPAEKIYKKAKGVFDSPAVKFMPKALAAKN